MEKVTRSGGGEANAGRRLVAWARMSGFKREQLKVSAVVEVFSSREEREFIGSRYAERILYSDLGRKAIELGLARQEDLESMAEAWKRWIEDDDGYLGLNSTEILCQKA